MVTCTKGEGGLNFDADAIRFEDRAVVRAVHDKPASVYRFETCETLGDPVRGGDWLDAKRACCSRAGHDSTIRRSLASSGALQK